MTVPGATGRVNQKTRTRMAILRAASELMFTGRDVSMPEIASAALVSEATAYRYFPDLATLLQAAMAEHLPEPADALASVAGSTDPAERIAAATEFLLRLVWERRGAIRAVIAATITRPQAASVRPGLRFGLILSADEAIASAVHTAVLLTTATLGGLAQE
jgi:AcrR family transcriptional regulator